MEYFQILAHDFRFLEPGYYLILCLAFNHWDLNPTDGEITHYPPCVLALHSSKRTKIFFSVLPPYACYSHLLCVGLLVEHITPSPFVLADGLISLTMAKGQRYEVCIDSCVLQLDSIDNNIATLSFLLGKRRNDGLLLDSRLGKVFIFLVLYEWNISIAMLFFSARLGW